MKKIMTENSVIPLRRSSLPGVVRLPNRYKPISTENIDAKRISSVGQTSVATAMEDRISDLSQALLWLKQELIMMRQHDILLKRQFCEIHNTIHSLHRRVGFSRGVTSSNNSLHSTTSSTDITLEIYGVRNASSVTLLNEEDDEEDDELVSFRPRTSSMKTTRDLAALARRRGSKELI